jgi:hypothetical protein
MANMSESFDPFARHRQGRSEEPGSGPRPGANTVSSELAQKLLPAQRLLDWLQHWAKPTVSARDIYMYGPRSIRDRERAIDLAGILVGHGWLIPNKTRRRDMREWQIVRKPIIHPTVVAE